MEDLTLRYFDAEMRYLREAAKEFAQTHPDRAASFFAWHEKLLEDVSTLRSIEGLDRIAAFVNELD